jgi:signal transduction histidine kinase
VIHAEVEAIDRRVRSLLDMGRPPVPVFESLDYVAVAEDVVRLLKADASKVAFIWRERPDGAPATSDRLLLRSALLNVLQNALQAIEQTGRPGQIELGLRETALGYELTVEDNGPGLPIGDPEVLFQPFASRRPGGTGIGLAVARGAIKALGGQLTLGPRETGGASALFTLPVRSFASAPEPTVDGANPISAGQEAVA